MKSTSHARKVKKIDVPSRGLCGSGKGSSKSSHLQIGHSLENMRMEQIRVVSNIETENFTRCQDCGAQRNLEGLEKENVELRKELNTLKELYTQLVREGPAENYEERRVLLLKSQVIQLERQTSDSCVIMQSAMFMGEFLRPTTSSGDETTLLDVCSGKLEHLNLKHVAKLESKLFPLLKQLYTLKHNLSTTYSKSKHSSAAIHLSEHASIALRNRTVLLLVGVVPLLSECCQSLMELSLLVPSAPWPSLRKPVRSEVTVANVLAAMPSVPRSKQKQAQSVVESLLKSNNYSRQVTKLELQACTEELKFHQEVYELQMQYTQAVFHAVQDAYSTFESDMRETVCIPLTEILDHFKSLKENASEEALKSFLSSFKTHSDKLQHLLVCLETNPDKSNNETSGHNKVLSVYERNFFGKIDTLIETYSTRRRKVLQESEEVKGFRDMQLEETVKVLTPDKKEK